MQRRRHMRVQAPGQRTPTSSDGPAGRATTLTRARECTPSQMHPGYAGDSSRPVNTDVRAPATKADHTHPNCGAV
eukprot:11975592-Alexandrium_andersonii.AAC.1